MKSVNEFISYFPPAERGQDNINLQFSELGNLQTFIDTYETVLIESTDYELAKTTQNPYCTTQYSSQLINQMTKLNDQIDELFKQEPNIKRQLPDPDSLFARNKQFELCSALAQMSSAYSIVEAYKEQLKLNQVVCVENKVELEIILEQAVEIVKDNIKSLDEEAVRLGIM
ncbi:Conserved_hypothetical protein [Hexamita inflata]|uniref:Uncharacterized protein n=1 Tax=Hexamita inflata TaxID=28002 RepID=A0AA86RKX1_9EUKA|nr:Conserved hypothetical protein [Hexamita inflata]